MTRSRTRLPPHIAHLPKPRNPVSRFFFYTGAAVRLGRPKGRIIFGSLMLAATITMILVTAGAVDRFSAFQAATACPSGITGGNCLAHRDGTVVKDKRMVKGGDQLEIWGPGPDETYDVTVNADDAFIQSLNNDAVTMETWRGRVVTLTAGGVTKRTESYPSNDVIIALIGLVLAEMLAWGVFRSAAKTRLGVMLGHRAINGPEASKSGSITVITGLVAAAGTVLLGLDDITAGVTVIAIAYAIVLYSIAVPLLIPGAARAAGAKKTSGGVEAGSLR